MPPTGYHCMVSALVETFQVIPLGEAVVRWERSTCSATWSHQSFSLGVQIGAPLLGVMSLVALTMGFLGHSIPQINVLVVGFPVRLVSMSVLMASLSGIARAVVDAIPTRPVAPACGDRRRVSRAPLPCHWSRVKSAFTRLEQPCRPPKTAKKQNTDRTPPHTGPRAGERAAQRRSHRGRPDAGCGDRLLYARPSPCARRWPN